MIPHSSAGKALFALAIVVLLAGIAGIAYVVNGARDLEESFDFDVPSDDQVLRDVEGYYANHARGQRRPRGKLAGCPDREAGLWYHCVFLTPTKVTCVHIYVDEPCCSWEESRFSVRATPRRKRLASQGAFACS